MNQVNHDQIRQNVRNRYKEIAIQDVGGGNCCTPSDNLGESLADVSSKMGYSSEELSAVPEGANLGLGCGNPQAIAALQPGEVVLDLGSGGGFDCFLASRQVGDLGRVIGVDMTPEMINRARENAQKNGFKNTEFRLGEIEHLPVRDHSVDVIISNCVINLSPSKQQVLNEAFRTLRSGGRLAISDVVTTTELPVEIKKDIDRVYSGCISGASSINELESMLEKSGFINITIESKDESRAFIKNWIPGANVEQYLVSASICAIKP